MSERPEPCHDIAYLSHVELLTPSPNESLWYFRDVLEMSEVAREGQSVYLRAWGEYELASLKLTEAQLPGVAHTASRAESPQALARLVTDLETSGLGRGWTPGDIGHGAAYQSTDPDGHLQEVYYETVKYQAPAEQRPALKNQPQRASHQGVGVRRLDHINYLGREPQDNRNFVERYLGAKATERIVLDDGTEAETWVTYTNKAYDVVYTKDATGSMGNVLRSVARHRLVLATGHLARNEIFAVVEAALSEGVKDIIITHPDYPSRNLPAEEQVVLAREGAYLKHCFAPIYTGKVPWERMFASIRAVGVEHAVLSTDLGQPDNPPIEDGLPLMVDRLLAAGFSEDEVQTLAVTNTRRLALRRGLTHERSSSTT